MWLDHQYRLCGAAQSRHPSARGGNRTPGQYALPGRSGLAGSVGTVPGGSQLRVAPRQSAPAVAGPRRHQWPWLSEGVAAVYPGDGSGIDRSRVVAQRGPVLPGTTVAATASAVAVGPGRWACKGAGWVCLETGKEV